MAYDGSEPIKSLAGELVPQVWDDTLDGGAGGFRVISPDDLAGEGPLSAPSSNIPDTTVPTGTAAALPSGSCARGFMLQANETNSDVVRWGAVGLDATHGGRLLPGDSVPIEVADSGAIYVVSATAGQVVAGVRF